MSYRGFMKPSTETKCKTGKVIYNSRRAAEPAESATKIVSNFFQNGGQFERLFNNQIYGINYKKQRFLGFLEAWLQDHEENEFFEVIC